MDPVELRLKNYNLTGSPFEGRPYSNPGIATTLTEAAKAIGWADKWHAPRAREVRPGVFHGIGIASHTCNHGAGTAPASGMVVLNTDGSMNIISGSNEIGPGQRTQMVMIAAEALGIPFERTFITPEVDTDLTPDAGSTTGSRQTNTGGWGVYEAALDAKAQVLEWGARLFVSNAADEDPPREIEVTADMLDLKEGLVFFKDDPETNLPVGQVVASSSGPILGRAVHLQDPTWTRLCYGTQAAEVEVDTVTGTVTVTKYVAAHDIGRAINPFALEQQIEGGVVMSLGAALTEELLLDTATGLPITDNILEYKALSIKDVPAKIDIVLVEHPKEYGVYGAHGIGEPAIALAGPVISNAVYNAIGIRIPDLPITRNKILAGLNSA
jgi:xanthine dehydrogenase molybdenum-binding subunit